MAITSAILKAKIGQMLIVGFTGLTLSPGDPIVKAIVEHQIGGVILFDYNFKTKADNKNIQSPTQLKQLTQQLQSYAKQASITGESIIPLLIGIDYEGGAVNRLKEKYGFPQTLSAAELGRSTPDQVQFYATQMTNTLKQAGINLNFAPVLDVNTNSTNPIIGKLDRSFSTNPQKVIEMARIFAKTYEENGIISAFKHFPGHGSSTGDTHEGFVDITDTWQASELEPFKTLIQESTNAMVMTAHVVNRRLDSNAYPASLSSNMTTQLLRHELGYKGVVVTDDLQMKAITDNYSLREAVILAIKSGADLLIFGNQLSDVPQSPEEIIDIIYQAVLNGEISESRIDESYQRIKALKASVTKRRKQLVS